MSVSESSKELIVVENVDGIIQSGSLTPPANKSNPSLGGISSVSEECSFEEIAAYMVPKLLAHEESISLYEFKIPIANAKALFVGIINEHPELYFVENSYSYYTSGGYIYSLIPFYNTTTEYDDAAFQTAVEDALSLLDASMTDYEKALVLHDYLVLNCEYDLNFGKVAYSAYGALVSHTCVCQGYSLAYKYLLKKAGIECLIVTSEEMNHAWNMVVIDGRYYQTDVTWDDPIKDRLSRARHIYFLISDDKLSDDHSGWIIQKNGETLNAAADNTRFNDAYWNNINSGIFFSDNAWFYLDGSRITRSEARSERTATLHTIADLWFAWEPSSGFWMDTYSGLALLNGKLFFNTPTAICSISTSGGAPAEKYAPIVYTITYELNDGSENPNPASYTIGSETIVLKSPVRENYTFTGWFTDTALTKESTEIPVGSYGDLALYAGWKGTVPTPTASLESGSIVDKNETVELFCELKDASIYYTLDGSVPDRTGALYLNPIVLTKNCTLQAIAVRDEYFDSEIAAWTYTVYKNELILSEEALTLAEGETFMLSVLEIPETKDEADISWSSSDTTVADVSDSGIITA